MADRRGIRAKVGIGRVAHADVEANPDRVGGVRERQPGEVQGQAGIHVELPIPGWVAGEVFLQIDVGERVDVDELALADALVGVRGRATSRPGRAVSRLSRADARLEPRRRPCRRPAMPIQPVAVEEIARRVETRASVLLRRSF
jgi:hypothetical protein